jgi:hypothetical protein
VLALGVKIVRELELDPGVDTLGRWLAHHLAELMLSAENTKGGEREVAQNKAVELILKIWSRRHDMPGRANPLKQLENVIVILRLLSSDAWPYGRASTPSAERLLKKAFDGLRHIVMHGAVIASGAAGKPVEMAEADGFVDEDEAYVIETANVWIDFYNSTQQNSAVRLIWEDTADLEARKTELDELAKLDPETRARMVFVKQIDQLVETLSELKANLGAQRA